MNEPDHDERLLADYVRTDGDDPTFPKGMDIHPNWICICDHTIDQHTQVENDAVACMACTCPDFCTAQEADEVIDVIYEWALENGETWAGTAHEYRRLRAHRAAQDDGPDAGRMEP